VIYVVFSREGYEALSTHGALVAGTQVRINPGVLSADELTELGEAKVTVHVLAEPVNGERESEVVATIEAAEADHPSAEIEVEYQ